MSPETFSNNFSIIHCDSVDFLLTRSEVEISFLEDIAEYFLLGCLWVSVALKVLDWVAPHNLAYELTGLTWWKQGCY